MRKGFLVALLGLAALSNPMFGNIVIDFGQGLLPVGGTITESGGNASGVNVDVQTMTVSGDPISADNGVYYLFGAGTTAGGSDGSAVVTFNTATGLFTVVGGVCNLGAGFCNGTTNVFVASTTLANGTGSSANVLIDSSSQLVFTEPDTKASTLLTALGIAGTQFALANASFNDLNLITGNTYATGSTDIANTSVPEPTSVLLFGTVLFGVTRVMRRRSRKA